jgi:hypothetical protein
MNVMLLEASASNLVLRNVVAGNTWGGPVLKSDFSFWQLWLWRKNTAVWIIKPCSPERTGRFGGTCRLHLRSWIVDRARNEWEQATSRNAGLSPNYTVLTPFILEPSTSVCRMIFGKYVTLIRIVLIEKSNMETIYFFPWRFLKRGLLELLPVIPHVPDNDLILWNRKMQSRLKPLKLLIHFFCQ